jgi:putative transposase
MLMCDATGMSQRRACRLTGLSLSTCRYEAHRPAADAHYQGRITGWHWSAGVLATVVFGSCCAVKGFMLIISACTGFITSVAWRKTQRRRKVLATERLPAALRRR